MLSKYFKKNQKECWRLIDRKYPELKNKYDLLYELAYETIKEIEKAEEKIAILDAGCGRSSRFDFQSSAKITYIGADLSPDNIRNNNDIDYGFVCDLTEIPVEKKSVDIIVSAMVFEHLKNPKAVLREFNRILKPNGYLLFATPCIYNIVVIVNRIIPNQASKLLGKGLTGADENDIYPTSYKINSPGNIRKYCGTSGFKEVDLIMYQPPPYAFVFSTFLCRIMIYYYRLINRYDFMKILRGVIIARYKKEEQMDRSLP